MVIVLNLKSKFSQYITVKSLLTRGKVSDLLSKLKQNNSFELDNEVFRFLSRTHYFELRNGKVVKLININSREIIRKLKEYNDIRKAEHEKIKQLEVSNLYSSSSNMKLNNYNDRQTREYICRQVLYGI